MKKITFLLLFLPFFGCKDNLTSNKNDFEEQKSGIESNLLDIDKLPQALQQELEEPWWLGNYDNYSIKQVIQKKDGIVISGYTEEITKNMILTNNYIIFSYAVGGSEERTLIYNKNSKSYSINDYYAFDLKDDTTIIVQRDYYDDKDVNDPNYEGHVFEKGELNLINNRYKKTGLMK